MSSKKAYLKEMGIDVWVERNPVHQDIRQDYSEVTPNIPAPPQIELESNNKPEVIPKANIETLDWQALCKHVAECQLCELSKTRSKILFSSGNQNTSLMIIGNAPTEEDEQKGEFFSGQAGKLLTAMLKAMGYQRNDVYISDILKCKTLENKEPSDTQAESCAAYLLREISLLKPKLILALGNSAAQQLLKTKSTMSRLRGQLHYIDGIISPIIVSYHPTYLLAAPNEKRKAWDDLQLAMKELKQ